MSEVNVGADKDILLERLELADNRIRQIKGEHISKYAPYFEHVADHLIRCIDIYKGDKSLDDIESSDVDELSSDNVSLYSDILDYDNSYLNPDVTTKLFGDKLGGWYAFLYNELMALIPWSYDGALELLVIYLELFLQMYGVYEEELACDNPDITKALHRSNECIYWFYHDYCELFQYNSVKALFEDDNNVIHSIVSNADLSKNNYLYAYGVPISDNDIRLASYINSLPESDIDDIASCYVGGFVKGYEAMGKDLTAKSIVKVEYPIGFERVVRKSEELFATYNLTAVYARDGASSFTGGPRSRNAYLSSMNKQWIFDHRNDKGYYFDKRFYNRRLECMEEAFKKYADKALEFAGPAVIGTFGETEFDPTIKSTAYTFTSDQNKWNVEYLSKAGVINNTYMPREGYSYTIIAFPIPEIGDEAFFKKVFDETMKLNTLDYDRYLRMQQCIIDVLDKADYVHVLGQGDNATDIRVNLHTLSDPSKQTNFENCVADVNIPVGEVFTSPVLTGTEGVLNVSHVFLNGLAYRNLTIKVKDGKVVDYSCDNFDDPAEGKKYIFENVMYRHETLPIGEFAIGTNTTAYRMAREYDIEAKLPILIAEKTGPHFAFGDTCYSHEEDMKLYNPDGKEIIAKENECSALRDTDMSKAYFNCHTDVTMPFDELALIEVVTPIGEHIPIIQNGIFVVDGCEELNEPLT